MPGPFDTTTKFLVQTYPRDWLTYLGLAGPGPITVIDADLSTVTAEADKVLLLHAPSPYLVHLEFQASPDARMGQRLARYNLLLGYRHALPVASVLVLLRPEAQSPGMTGQWHSAAPGGDSAITFRYSVLRIWEEPGERLLAGPLGLVPLAPLATIPPADLPEVVRRVERRIETEASPTEAQVLEVVTFTLLGLRFSPEIVQQLMPGIHRMRESSTYQLILDEGRAEGEARGRAEGEARGEARGRAEGRASEAREFLLLIATDKLGPPDPATRAALERIVNVEELERLGRRLLQVGSWHELLTTQ